MVAPSIRAATLGDVTRVVAAVSALLAELRGDPEATAPCGAALVCEKLISGEIPGTIFIAGNGGDNSELPTGLAGVSVQEAIHLGGRYALLQELWVHPDHRSGGIGSLLLSSVEEYCRKQGLGSIEVGLPAEKFAEAQRTRQFYERNAFRPIGQRMRRNV